MRYFNYESFPFALALVEGEAMQVAVVNVKTFSVLETKSVQELSGDDEVKIMHYRDGSVVVFGPRLRQKLTISVSKFMARTQPLWKTILGTN